MTAHHFPPYHIEAAQTPVCVVSDYIGSQMFRAILRRRLLFYELNSNITLDKEHNVQYNVHK